ncbi:putative protein UXT -like protein [Capsicum annuum]|nr:putative protein UXT -like protein [Capsicum annuum]
MWVPAIRSSSYRNVFKNIQFIRLKSISSVAQLSPYLSDSSSDEQIANNHMKNNELINNTVEVNSYWVTEMLNSLREEPNDALSFFRQLKESGFKHDIQTYMGIIRIFCYWGMNMKLDSLFLEVINAGKEGLGFEVSDLFEQLVEGLNAEGPNSLVRALDALVKAYASLRMFDESIDVLFQTKRCSFGLSVLSCNYLMNQLVECGKVDMAVAVYKQFKMISVTPNVYTYGIVIKALCRKGDLEEAVGVFEEMEKAGETPNEFTYSTYIEGLCSYGRSDLAYDVLRAWKGVNVPLDGYAYTAVIRGFVNEKKLQEAEIVLLDMEEQGMVPDAFCYGAVVNGYCNTRNMSKALAFHDKMEAKGIKSNCVIVSSILQCLCKNGKASDAVDQFSRFKNKGIFLDEVVYNGVIDALCKLGRFEEAEKLLDEMKGKRMTPDIVHYTTLINGYCLHGRILDAMGLFDEMKEKGLKPDVITYNVLAGGFSRNGLFKETLHLLDHMKGQSLTPTTVTHNMIIEGLCIGGYVEEAEIFINSLENKSAENYSALVNGYCELGNTKGAFGFFVRLSKQGVLIKRKSRLKLLSNLCLEGEYEKALKLFEIVLALGDDTCKIMYSKLIASLCSAGDMKSARWVFDNMIWRGLAPDVVIYTVMLNGYCRSNSLQEALNLFDDMKKRGISPDVITYTVMLDGHSKNIKRDRLSSGTRRNVGERKDTGLSIGEKMAPSVFLSEMNEAELTADVICYTVLIDSRCKSDNIDDAIRLFTEMIDKGLEPDSVTYTALICGYCKQGHVEKAKDLVNKMWRKGIQPDSHTISALHHGIIKAKKLHLRHHNNSAKNQSSMKPGVGKAQLSVLILRLQIFDQHLISSGSKWTYRGSNVDVSQDFLTALVGESSNIQSSNLEEGLTPFSLHQRDNGTDIPGILESRNGICFIKCRVQRSLCFKLTSGDKCFGYWAVPEDRVWWTLYLACPVQPQSWVLWPNQRNGLMDF